MVNILIVNFGHNIIWTENLLRWNICFAEYSRIFSVSGQIVIVCQLISIFFNIVHPIWLLKTDYYSHILVVDRQIHLQENFISYLLIKNIHAYKPEYLIFCSFFIALIRIKHRSFSYSTHPLIHNFVSLHIHSLAC